MSALDWFFVAKRAAWRIAARIPFGARCRCNICHREVRRFLPYRNGLEDVPPLIRRLSMVGSDVERFECPACGCNDRERHLLMYLRASGLLSLMEGSTILHLAPERHLRRIIRTAVPAEYVLGDLHPTEPEITRMDLQALEFPDCYFDFVIANHVLEHVQDDMRALGEILRVLKPGGHAVLQTPFSRVLLHAFDDPGIVEETARLHAFGQEDHCRLYGRDIAEHFASAGFRSLVADHSAILPEADCMQLGVNPDEPFLLFQKAPEA